MPSLFKIQESTKRAVGWASSISDPALRINPKTSPKHLATTDPEKANQWRKKNDPNKQ